MTDYSFAPQTAQQSVAWHDPTIWAGGVVPNGADANVTVPLITVPATNMAQAYFITIASGESYQLGNLTLLANYLLLDGALTVTGALVSDGELDLDGADLSVGSLQNNGYDIQGSGRIGSAQTITNNGLIVGNGLTLALAGFTNTGTLTASGTLTVTGMDGTGATGQFTNLDQGTLTGGSYTALGTLNIDVGGAIITDNANMTLAGGTINSIDPNTGTRTSLQNTLQQIGANGSLTLAGDTYQSVNALTVAGNLRLQGSSAFSAPQLAVMADGTVSGIGTVTASVANNGVIRSGLNGDGVTNTTYNQDGTLLIQGPITGSGSLTVGAGAITFIKASAPPIIWRSTLELAGPDSEDVTFADSTGILKLDAPAAFTGTIRNASFTASANTPQQVVGNTIILSGIDLNTVTSTSYSGDAAGGVLTIQEGSTTQTLHFTGSYTIDNFAFSAGPQAVSTAPPSLAIGITEPPVYAISAGNANQAEATTGASTPFTFTVTRYYNTAQATTLTYGVTASGGSGATAANFAGLPSGTLPSGQIAFAAGQITATLTIDVAAGQTIANPLGFAVTIAPVGSGTVTQAVAQGVIQSNFAAPAGAAMVNASHDQALIFASPDGSGTIQAGTGQQSASGPTNLVFSDGVGVFDATGNSEDVARLYQAAFGRTSDLAGLNYWATQIAGNALSLPDVAASFIASGEFQTRYGALSDSDYVGQLYQNVLGRTGDASGVQYWTGLLGNGLSRNQVLVGFSNSTENVQNTSANIGDQNNSEVYRLYQAAFGHAPDAGGLSYWATALQGGATPLAIAQGFTASPEFAQNYAGTDSTSFVAQLYTNILHRTPDAAGAQYWASQLDTGASRSAVLLGLADSGENRAATASATHDSWVFLPG